jgi:glucose-6-phosphate 1-dehydrogenase
LTRPASSGSTTSWKETVQNILALRFANGIFKPIWNRDHVEHVQIDVPETLSISTRASFYEQTGAYRDIPATVTDLYGSWAVAHADALRACPSRR